MKRLHLFPVLACAGLLLTAVSSRAAARGSGASPVLREQIDALLKARQWPEPLPIDPPNPFVIIHDSTRSLLAATSRTAAPAKAGDDPKPVEGARPTTVEAAAAEILGNTAARLKLGGVMQLKDQMQIVVNDLPRRAGDFIMVTWNGVTYPLRVVRIEAGLLVLRYEGAEMMLRF